MYCLRYDKPNFYPSHEDEVMDENKDFTNSRDMETNVHGASKVDHAWTF